MNSIKKVPRSKKNDEDVTLNEFFEVVDEVVKKAKTDPASKEIIDSAEETWRDSVEYVI